MLISSSSVLSSWHCFLDILWFSVRYYTVVYPWTMWSNDIKQSHVCVVMCFKQVKFVLQSVNYGVRKWHRGGEAATGWRGFPSSLTSRAWPNLEWWKRGWRTWRSRGVPIISSTPQTFSGEQILLVANFLNFCFGFFKAVMRWIFQENLTISEETQMCNIIWNERYQRSFILQHLYWVTHLSVQQRYCLLYVFTVTVQPCYTYLQLHIQTNGNNIEIKHKI